MNLEEYKDSRLKGLREVIATTNRTAENAPLLIKIIGKATLILMASSIEEIDKVFIQK